VTRPCWLRLLQTRLRMEATQGLHRITMGGWPGVIQPTCYAPAVCCQYGDVGCC
jgi:hypothetical protein